MTFAQVYVEEIARETLLAVAQPQSALAQVLSLQSHQTPILEPSVAPKPDLETMLKAIVALSFASESLLDSFFSHSDAVGSLMRRKMKLWGEPMLAQINVLLP